MSRPRTISDASVTETVAALLVQTGPGGLTFASAAAATGLSPATLVQRFGSRDALLRAALLSMWDQVDGETAAADAAQAVSAEGAVDVLIQLSAGYGSGEAAAEGLLLLREDYRDPVLRARGAAWNVALAAALGRRLSDDRGGSATSGPADGQPVAGRGALVGLFARRQPDRSPAARTQGMGVGDRPLDAFRP